MADNLWRGKIENLYYKDNPIIDLNKKFFKVDLRKDQHCLDVSKDMDIVIHLADIVAGINFVFEMNYSCFDQI